MLLLVFLFIWIPYFVISAGFLVDNGFFRDEYNRVRIFHGVSRVQKGWPWYDESILTNDKMVDRWAELGFNVVRLGWMFTGFNPTGGVFNETYFEISKKVVEKLASRGITVILDTHQDLMSSLFCLYDGFPLWVVSKTQKDLKHPFPWPLRGTCGSRVWGENALAEALQIAYQSFYDNKFGIRDDFISFWKESAKRWKGVDSVLGYEIINEPFAGDIYSDPELLLPGEAGRKNLLPLYDSVAAAIRSEDKEHILFYEPIVWGMILNGSLVGSGFDHVPGGSNFKNMSAYSYRYYCWLMNPGGLRKVGCDDVMGPEVFRSVKELVKDIGGSSMMTEFCAAGDNEKSWCEWDYTDGEFNPTEEYIEVFSRTYARAIAGTPVSTSFDFRTKEFKFCWDVDLAISEPTEIYFNSEMYPNLKIQKSENLEVSVKKNLVLVKAVSEGLSCIEIVNE